MKQPHLKRDLFRLVDVLPSLRSNESIARHVGEYLQDAVGDFPWIVRWGARPRPGSVRGTLTSLAVKKGVREMASQFIAGEGPSEAEGALRRIRRQGMAFTVDLLGEFCVSEREALAYLERYLECLEVLGTTIPRWPERASLFEGHPGELSPLCISVKLSALYSQTGPLNFERSVSVLSERLETIIQKAAEVHALVYVDAEDSATNTIVYEVFKRVFSKPEFCAFPFPGIVVQAYAKNSLSTLLDLIAFARERGPIAVRLVKGAYWDYETVLSEQQDWESPLFKNKSSSDAQYETLTRVLIDNANDVLPAFASHNIRSLAHACCYAEYRGVSRQKFELQMLYGMADPIARAFTKMHYLVRFYVPLGALLPGMGYLVRRLLENTSNESFLRHTFFEEGDVDDLLRTPEFRD